MDNIESVLFDHYSNNDGDLFITSNGYKSSLLGSNNIYPDHEYVNHNYTPQYTNEEYRKGFATPTEFIKIITKTTKAYLFELPNNMGRWVPFKSINSVKNNVVWIYEKEHLAKPFKLDLGGSEDIKQTQQQEQITLETINKKLDLILKLLNK